MGPRPTPPVGRPARWPGRAAFRTSRSGDSERLRAAAAPFADLQALRRSRVRGQGPRHRRAPPAAAGPGGCALRRREEPDTGARPHAARAADAPGHSRSAAPRPQVQRDDPAVRRPRHRRRLRHRQVLRAPPVHGVPGLPEGDRCPHPQGAGRPYRHGQHHHPQDRRRRGGRIGMSVSRRPRPPGPIRSGAGSPNRRGNGCSGAHMPRQENPKRISAPSSKNTTGTRNPSGGRSPPTTFLDAVKRFRHRVNHNYSVKFKSG